MRGHRETLGDFCISFAAAAAENCDQGCGKQGSQQGPGQLSDLLFSLLLAVPCAGTETLPTPALSWLGSARLLSHCCRRAVAAGYGVPSGQELGALLPSLSTF